MVTAWKAARALGAIMLGLALLVLVAFAVAQTRPGKDWIAEQVARAVSGNGTTASLGRIAGTVPFDMRIDGFRLADAEGEFLTATNLAFALVPRALLHGRVEITRLSADDIAVARLPESKGSTSPQPLQLPRLPFDLVLDDVAIGAIRLAAPVLGEPVALSAHGAMSLVGGEATARAAIRRIDGEPGHADLLLALTGQPAQLELALDIAEPSGLLLDRLFGREDRPPLAVSLKGTGPLTDWHGTLAASAGDLARLDVDLAIAANDGLRLGARGTIAALPILAREFAPVLGDRITFAAQIHDTGEGSLSLEQFSVDAAAARIAASGRYDGRRKTIAATATLTAADLAPFSTLAGMTLAGAGQLGVTASGTTERPQLDLTLDGSELRAAGDGAEHVTARFHLASEGDIARPDTRVAVTGEGRVEKLVRATGAVPATFGAAVEWHLAGSSAPTAGEADITELTVTTAGLSLTGSAATRGHGETVEGKASLVVADLAQFSALAGQALHGSGKLDVIASTAADGTVTAKLSGGLTTLTLGEPVDALLGGRLDVEGAARRLADGRLVVDKLDLSGAGVALSAAGELAADGKIGATIKLEVPRLAALSASLGTRMGGRLGLQANLRGPLAALAVTCALDGDGIVAGQGKLDRLHAALSIADMSAPNGHLEGTFRSGTLDGTLGGEFALRQGGKVLEVAKFRLAGSGGIVEGGLRVALDTGLASGTLNGRIADLAPWSQLAGMTLAGRADLKAVLDGKAGQSVELSLNGSGIKAIPAPGSAIAVARVAASAHLDNLRGAPSGHAIIDLGRSTMGDVKIEALTMKLDSTKPGRFTFTGEAHGDIGQKFALATAGDLAFDDAGAMLHVSRLSGSVAGETVQLKQTATITSRRADVAVANLALALGSGQLAGSFALKGDELVLTLKAGRLPVRIVGAFAGKPNVSGTVSFDVDLSGTRAKPQGRLVLDGRDLRLAAANRSDLPPLGITVEAVWHGGRVDAKGRIAGPKNDAIGFAGSAPVELTPGTLAVKLPPNGAVALKLEGTGQIADLQELLPLGEDRVAGKFLLDVSVSGTVAEPRAGGALRISEGHYESMAAGTVLSDIALDLVGDRERFVLQNFRAGDGERGQIAARGSVNLRATPAPALDAAIQIKSFRVLRRDEANVRAGGEIRVSGPLTALRIASRLQVEQGELRAPDRLPASAGKLEIVEINSVTGQKPAPRERQPERDPVLPAVLDITVDIPGQVFVRSHGLDSEWRGKLVVSGTSAEPIIVGTLEVVRGDFALLGKNFKLTSGTIRFNGDTKIDPTLDIAAEANTSDITGTVHIGGTASAPSLTLGSVPALPQDEVLSRILFGKSAGQISAAQGVQLAAAAASLAGGGAGILDKVRSALGLDRFDFGSGTTGNNAAGNASGNAAAQGGIGGAKVSAGKYIADGVYVGVDQGASTSSSRAKVEIEIAPHVSVETDVGASGGNGLGLNWKYDY